MIPAEPHFPKPDPDPIFPFPGPGPDSPQPGEDVPQPPAGPFTMRGRGVAGTSALGEIAHTICGDKFFKLGPGRPRNEVRPRWIMALVRCTPNDSHSAMLLL